MTDFSVHEIPEYGEPVSEYVPQQVVAPATLGVLGPALTRPRWLPVLFLMPLIFCGISWQCGGVPLFTDVGMFWLLMTLFVIMLGELKSFSRRFGVGAFVLFGGSLVWYMDDYMTNWFGVNFSATATPYGRETVAKAAFFTCLFIMSASAGLLMNPPKFLVRWSYALPEPPSPRVYFVAIMGMFAIGMIPIVFFTRGSLLENIYQGFTAMRSTTGGINFTTGRTGNLNYSWGGYLAQVMEVGEIGAILAMYYVVMIPGSRTSKVICILIWLYQSAMAFGGGSRGEFLFHVFPVAGLLFVRYMTIAASYLKRFSKRAVIYSSIFMFCTLVVVQIQGTFRTVGLEQADLGELQVFKNQGNSMFTEGLLGYQYFPGAFGYTGDIFPGATFIMPIPDVAVRYGISWIPRVLWHGKPGISAVGQWYNKQMSGGTAVNEEGGDVQSGGTVAPSISALAYMGYGWAGVVEIGILFGLLCKLAEQCLYVNLNKPFGLMFSMGLVTWLFRDFRDLTPHDLYPLLIGTIVGAAGIFVLNAFAGGAPAGGQVAYAGEES
ncbi:MAG: hypothetical protein ABSF29_13630 [Tepidisphaeraceae bacterium]|jgi:hypothetical protein